MNGYWGVVYQSVAYARVAFFPGPKPIRKYNPNHDARGRFSSGPSGPAADFMGGSDAYLQWHTDTHFGVENKSEWHSANDSLVARAMPLELAVGARAVLNNAADQPSTDTLWKMVEARRARGETRQMFAYADAYGAVWTKTGAEAGDYDAVPFTTRAELDEAVARVQIFAGVSALSQAWNSNSNRGRSTLIQDSIQRKLVKSGQPVMSMESLTGQGEPRPAQWRTPDAEAFTDAYTTAVYDRTQKFLKEQGITGLVGYRGMDLSDTHLLNPQQMSDIVPRPLSSYSTSLQKATGFAGSMSNEGGWVIKSEVTAESIFSIGGHSLGAFSEQEFTVIASPMESTAFGNTGAVLYTQDSVEKYNPNHDARGRFSTGAGGSSIPLAAPLTDPWDKKMAGIPAHLTPGDSEWKNTAAAKKSVTGESGRKYDMVFREWESPLGTTAGVVQVGERQWTIREGMMGRTVIEPDFTGPNGEGLASGWEGQLKWYGKEGEIDFIETAPPYRRDGLATAMLTFAREKSSTPVTHSDVLTADGKRFSTMVKFNPNHDERGRFSTGAGGSASYPLGGEATRALWPVGGLDQYSSQDDSAAAHRVADMEIAKAMPLTPDVVTGAYDVMGMVPEDRADLIEVWQERAREWQASPDWSKSDHIYIGLIGSGKTTANIMNDTVQPPDSIEVKSPEDMAAALDRFTVFQAANKVSSGWNTDSNDYGTSSDLQSTLRDIGLTRQDPYADNFEYGIELEDYTGYEAFLGAYAKATYAHTQKILGDRGIKGVIAYRGLDLSKSSQWEYGEVPESPHDIMPNALNSFSTNVTAAKVFAAADAEDDGWVLRAEIPAKSIFSIGGHGPGATIENEITVLGPDSWRKPTLYQYGTGATMGESGNVELGMADQWEEGLLKARHARKTLGGIGKRSHEVAKYNPNHDARGRFTSGSSTSGVVVSDGNGGKASSRATEASRVAFAAIAKVHKVTLPGVQVHERDNSVLPEGLKTAVGWYDTRVPGVLNLNSNPAQAYSDASAGTLVHEFAHMLDTEVFGTVPGRAQSVMPGLSGSLQGVLLAIDNSDEWNVIRQFHIGPRAGYLRSFPEAFARAYEQWIALRSGDKRIMADVEFLRKNERGWQWPDDEFEPIAAEMDKLFESKGLLNDSIVKYNPNHGADGRFTTGSGVGTTGKFSGTSPKAREVAARISPSVAYTGKSGLHLWASGDEPGDHRSYSTKATYTDQKGGTHELDFHMREDMRNDGTWKKSNLGVRVDGGVSSVAAWPNDAGDKWVIWNAATALGHRRKGLATAALELMRRHADMPVVHSGSLLPDGEKFAAVVKFNPNHDRWGRFTTSPSSAAAQPLFVDSEKYQASSSKLIPQDTGHIPLALHGKSGEPPYRDQDIQRHIHSDNEIAAATLAADGGRNLSGAWRIGAPMAVTDGLDKSVMLAAGRLEEATGDTAWPAFISLNSEGQFNITRDVQSEFDLATLQRVRVNSVQDFHDKVPLIVYRAATSKLSRSWNERSNANMALLIQDAIEPTLGRKGVTLDQIGGLQDPGIPTVHNNLSAQAFAREYVKATYARTQDYLKAVGVDTIAAHRGFKIYDEVRLDTGEVTPALRPLSSFSTSPATALRFSNTYEISTTGYVHTVKVKAEDIFSIGGIGPGAEIEGELIVLPHDYSGTLFETGTEEWRGQAGREMDIDAIIASVVQKYNPNHDARGRFTTSAGASGFKQDYRGQHTAPYNNGFSQNLLNAVGPIYPADFMSELYYGYGDNGPEFAEDEMRAISIIRRAHRDANGPRAATTGGGMVTVYRAVPKDTPRGGINPGDWVTPSRKYATLHGNGPLNGEFKIREKIVPAKHLYTEGDSLLEWGYDPSTEVHKFNPYHDARGRFTTGPSAAAPTTKISVEAYSQESGAWVHGVLAETLPAIAAVHEAPKITDVKVRVVDPATLTGRAANAEGWYDTREPSVLNMKYGTDNTGGTVIHEFGHMLDTEQFGSDRTIPNSMGVYTDGNTPMHKVFGEILNSQSFQRIAYAGKVGMIDKETDTYLRNPAEAFARAYHQWIVTRAGSIKLRAELDHDIATVAGQWDHEEFAPIARAMDRYFQDAGLLKGPPVLSPGLVTHAEYLRDLRTPTIIGKFNPNHDAKGRFASGAGLGASVVGGKGHRADFTSESGEKFRLEMELRTGGMYGRSANVLAFVDGHTHRAGRLAAMGPEDAPAKIASVIVADEYRRQGLATAMLEMARRHFPGEIEHDDPMMRTDDGMAWSAVAKFNPNHDARGRFTTGPSNDGWGDIPEAPAKFGDWLNFEGKAYDVDTEMGAVVGKDPRPVANHALAAISNAHRIPEMTRPLLSSVGYSGPGIGGQYSTVDHAIDIHPAAPTPEFTFVHEYGHALDHKVLGGYGEYGSRRALQAGPVDAPTAMTPWLKAVRASPEYATWKYWPNGAYYASANEMFARGYAQWVATKSGDPVLLEQLASRKDAWSAESFGPISAAYDSLFASKGMSK